MGALTVTVLGGGDTRRGMVSHTSLHFDTLSPGDWKRDPPAKASKSPVTNYETTVKHKVLLSTYYAH